MSFHMVSIVFSAVLAEYDTDTENTTIYLDEHHQGPTLFFGAFVCGVVGSLY